MKSVFFPDEAVVQIEEQPRYLYVTAASLVWDS